MHGGSISASSPGLDQGSTFTVKLPLAEPVEAKAELAAAAAPSQPHQALQVMVVDDNVDSAKTIAWMLEMMGHEPSLVHCGTEAINRARESAPDAILLDIGLPGISGYDVCRTLRADPAFRQTLMIAQTGWGQARDRAQAKDAGFDHHMTKPISFDQLSALLVTAGRGA